MHQYQRRPILIDQSQLTPSSYGRPFSTPWRLSEPRGYGLKTSPSIRFCVNDQSYRSPASLPLGGDFGVLVLAIFPPFLVKVLLCKAAFRYVELLFFKDPAVSFFALVLTAGLTLPLLSRMTSSGAANTPSKIEVTASTVKMETRGDQRIVKVGKFKWCV